MNQSLDNLLQSKRWLQFALLGVIILLAAGLRLYKLDAWSFWIDEIFTLRATPHIADWPIERLPLNLVLIRGATDLFGVSEWSARLAPALVTKAPSLHMYSGSVKGAGSASDARVCGQGKAMVSSRAVNAPQMRFKILFSQ